MKNKIVVWTVLFSGILLILISLAPFVFTRSWTGLSFIGLGEIGDTIGGTTAPLVGILTALLTFSAFYIQYDANRQQRSQIQRQEETQTDQRKREDVASFERTLFQLLEYHRQNVAELHIEDNKGTTFDGNFFITDVISTVDGNYNQLRRSPKLAEVSDTKLLGVTFLFVYYGNDLWRNPQIKARYAEYLGEVNLEEHRGSIGILGTKHYPVDEHGYGMFLSKYFRLIFQVFMFLKKHEDMLKGNPNFDRNLYLRVIRSILSNQEQIIIYFNSLTPLGARWLGENLILEYKVIKNIPLASLGSVPPTIWFREIFPSLTDADIRSYFEFYDGE